MKRISIIVLVFAMVFLGCGSRNDGFSYPKSKIWAHRVNEPEQANMKMKTFDGIEVDLSYDVESGELFVSHDIDKNMMQLTFRQYLQLLDRPHKSYYWLDVKNLFDNPDAICDTILLLADVYGFKNKFFVESWDGNALIKAHKKGIQTSLWVDNVSVKNTTDIKRWFEKYSTIVGNVNPDALSAEYHMLHLLVDNFPDKNIYLWQTPAEYNDENVEITKEICRDPHVKVLLIDYDKPIKY